MTARVMRQPVMSHYCDMWFSVYFNKIVYDGEIPALVDRNQWPVVDKGFYCLPPLMKKRSSGRQKRGRSKDSPNVEFVVKTGIDEAV